MKTSETVNEQLAMFSDLFMIDRNAAVSETETFSQLNIFVLNGSEQDTTRDKVSYQGRISSGTGVRVCACIYVCACVCVRDTYLFI